MFMVFWCKKALFHSRINPNLTKKIIKLEKTSGNKRHKQQNFKTCVKQVTGGNIQMIQTVLRYTIII